MAATDDKTNFYVTGGTAADNTNGGGPRLGTNDGPTYELTGGGGAGATSTDNGADTNIEDLNNGAWGDTQVDDWLCFDTADTRQFARVKAIDVGADTDVITVTPQLTQLADRSCSVCGAWETIDHACATLDSTNFYNAAGNPITTWIKGDSYPELATIDNVGTGVLPITLEGYKTTEGDGESQVFTDLPTMDGGDANDYGIRSGVGAVSLYWIIKHIYVKDSTGVAFIGSTSTDDCVLIHNKASGGAGWGIQGDNNIVVIGCEISDNAGGGIDVDTDCIIIANEVFGNGNVGILTANTFGAVIGNLVYDHATNNIAMNQAGVVMFNTVDGVFDDNNASVGIFTGLVLPKVVACNLIHDCNVPISISAESGMVIGWYNFWNELHSGNTNYIEGDGDSAEAANFPNFTNEGASNYQPTATSTVNGAAGPATLPAGLTTTNRAIGAAEPATASGAVVIAPRRGTQITNVHTNKRPAIVVVPPAPVNQTVVIQSRRKRVVSNSHLPKRQLVIVPASGPTVVLIARRQIRVASPYPRRRTVMAVVPPAPVNQTVVVQSHRKVR